MALTGTSCRWTHLQCLGVDWREAGQVGEDLERHVSSLVGLGLDLGGLLLQVLSQFLGLCVPGHSEGAGVSHEQNLGMRWGRATLINPLG